MSTTVRLFAALRDAAATSRTTSEAATVPALLDELRDRYGEVFARRLAVATVVVDGDPVDPDEPRSLEGVAEVVLLPPFSGGT